MIVHRIWRGLSVAILASLVLVGCDRKVTVNNTNNIFTSPTGVGVTVESVAISGNLQLALGSQNGQCSASTTLTATAKDANGAVISGVTFSWSVDPTDGVTNAGNGTFTFTVARDYTVRATATRSDGTTVSGNATVHVTGECGGGGNNPAPTLDISLTPPSVQLGNSGRITWTCHDATSATRSGGDWNNQPTTLTGSDPVTPSTTGTFTYTYTCKSSVGEVSKSVSLDVTPASSGGGGGGSGVGIDSVNIDPSSHTFHIGSGCTDQTSFSFTAYIRPDNADQGVTWTSSNPGVATVVGNGSSGTVSVVSAGNTTITVTSTKDGSKSKTASVTVDNTSCTQGTRSIVETLSSSSGSVGSTLTASARCYNGSTQTSCSPWFYSSDPSKVSVDPNSGAIKILSTGTANVCAQWDEYTITNPTPDCHPVTGS